MGVTQAEGASLVEASYKPFTTKAALELANPPTLVASTISVLVGGAAAVALSPEVLQVSPLRSVGIWVLMFITSVLMQAAVNTFNDYADFNTGLDTAETILDETDASIVYNEINPKSARNFGIALLACAAIFGLVVVLLTGWPLLIVGLSAAFVVVWYSIGPKPISYLPLGEVMAGVVLGGLIVCATYYAMTQTFSPILLAVGVPPTITIALIMQTNNTCDIERDIAAGRRTLPVLIGRERSIGVAKMLARATPVYMVIWVAVFDVVIWRSFLLLFMDALFAVGLYVLLRKRMERIGTGPYDLINRAVMMKNINDSCRSVNLCWVLILLTCWLVGDLYFVV